MSLHLPKMALVTLLFSSLFFYAYWDPRFLILLCGSILFNYLAGEQLQRLVSQKYKKIFLLGAVGVDLALLFYFKYVAFFLSMLIPWLGPDIVVNSSILPLGISFFTFTQIAYLVDVYQKKANRSSLVSYSLFVTVFPHLIAGPILHHKEMTDQFNRFGQGEWWSTENFAKGLFLFVIGLGKKVLIADYLAGLVKPIFDGSVGDPMPFLQAWFGAITYTLQLYFDFSGYSDMAVGLGLLFNLHLPINFNSPYQATSIIDFWRRWHISLSTFLKDYLYIPLGGNRQGHQSKMRNLFLTMLLGGLWHGAGWTFVLWGACHGFFLVINHTWRWMGYQMKNSVGQILTLLAVIIAWVIFRSPTIEMAFHILKGMIGGNGIVLPAKLADSLGFLSNWGIVFMHLENSLFKAKDVVLIPALMLIVLFLPNSNALKERFSRYRWAGAVCGGLFLFALLNLKEVTEFLYYQF
ncbi:MBOAT family O-acyltransferase [Candidatus Protochlamydia phocaeensis]|uniref:MBOAT family O-acyltransferase n=1 Tax=Candidatus Protochlamydia phocaeensis TaxID=1414722 RepID=UPI001E550BA9|nr:MBOAT family protein [Candidatus Protochlamydia phocaeensis]